MKINSLDAPFEHYLDLIRTGRVFSFSRWGDGEWISAMGLEGKEKANCDGHAYFPEMGRMLRAILKSKPPYIMAMQMRAMGTAKPLRTEGAREKWYSFLESKRIDLIWQEAIIFHEASSKGELPRLVEALRTRPVVLVGPPHLKKLSPMLACRRFIEVPPKDCFLSLDRIGEEIKSCLANMPEGSVLSLSCAMSANILIDRLYPAFGGRFFLIDFGSLWDPYAGIKSRTYHHRMPEGSFAWTSAR